MSRYTQRFVCAEEGCNEGANFAADTRKEQSEQYRRYHGKWRCVRHDHPQIVLGVDNPIRVSEVASVQLSHGLYWGERGSGFNFGPGFRAFAKDFPAGTILRVTAEIILPGAANTQALASGKAEVATVAEREGSRDEPNTPANLKTENDDGRS